VPGRRRTPAQSDRISLLHEVRVYREELEAQNEELAQAQLALEESRDRFVQLYDAAPVPHLTLDFNGIIVQANATAVQMIGKPRQLIEGMPMLGMIARESRGRYLDFLRLCRAQRETGHAQLTVEVKLRLKTETKDVQIVCRPVAAPSGSRELLTNLIDLSERRAIEAERSRAFRENALLASRLLSAQDEERQRIARDLHDHVGQEVTSLRLILQVALMNAVNDETRQRLEQALKIVDDIDQQLDFMNAELRPASLDLGLASAIEQFVRDWSSTFRIAASVQCHGLDGVAINPDVQTHVYRVVQEALNNAFKHAHPTHVDVRLEHRGDEIHVAVEDDGRGFDEDVQSRQERRGLGLLGMRERAQLIGARLEIQTAPSRGTKVRLRVPIARRTESR